MADYDHKEIEKKWQDEWIKAEQFKPRPNAPKGKYYICDMFPYPSGAGLHVGHPKGYIATDVSARKKRMEGYSVLYPMGWDSFGLPAEGYAIKTGTPPLETTEKSVINYKSQISNLALSYDWSREFATHRPDFYKWTQWIFLKFFEKGLAYKKNGPVNWCPTDQTVLANEQVVDGKCERCDSVVVKKDLEQWYFKITDYADELVDGLESLDWPESTKINQRNWIGRSSGAEIKFDDITVFTTRPDTILGATYVVIAPEHPLAAGFPEAADYIAQAKNKSDIERTAEGKEKTGVKLSLTVLNPATGVAVPVYVADYVLGHYGTGAVMGVPAHDERDAAFAAAMGIPVSETPLMNFDEAVSKFGTKVTKYKLRDWLVSRQRYWGAPIPIVYDPEGNAHPIPDEHLPWLLPTDVEYLPKGTSPLGSSKELQERTERIFGAGWRPEIDTMDTFVDSSWYFMRYTDPHNDQAFASPDALKQWLPIDLYVGGAEHTVLHLMYARFFVKVLRDMGLLSINEPFMKLRHVGLVLAEDGRKMSKRWGNVINPDDVVARFGADSMRLYEMFMGPFNNAIAWSTDGLVGTRRFVERVWGLAALVTDAPVPALDVPLNQAIKKVGEDIDGFKFNTAVSQLMIFLNAVDGAISKSQYESFLKLLAPFAPHVTDELWHNLGHKTSIHLEEWPAYEESKLVDDTVTIAVQVLGKLRGTVSVKRGASQDEVLALVKAEVGAVQALGEGVRVIFIPDRVINFVPTHV